MRFMVRNIFLAALVLAISPLAALADPAAADPAAILRAGKAASGGKAWDRVTGSRETGSHAATVYTTWLNYTRYGMRTESQGDGATTAQGFNGEVRWRVGKDKTVAASRDPAELREAITTAFFSNNGYFFPDRFPAASRYLRQAAEGDRTFDVIEVEPQGGRAAELWFDRTTHLIGRIADPHGPQPVTVDLSDFRKVGDVLVAFRGLVKAPDGTVLDEGKVQTVEYLTLPAATFDPPAGAQH
jgi:hypothetical protein